jgi:predicted SAM-dependent methyltransferase
MKIEFGSGEDPYKPDEFEHCDVRVLPHIEHICSAEKPPFAWNSVHEIFARDVLEHLPRRTVPTALKRWRNILVVGGKLDIVVPNLDFFIQQAYEYAILDKEPKVNWDKTLRAFYGGQRYKEDLHQWGFCSRSLAKQLQDVGFIGIVRALPSEVDRSDEYSLRMIAYKK